MSFAYINNPSFQNEELKSVYNKWGQRQFGKRIPVRVFGSGSEGNSVYIKPYRTLIDLGMAYKTYTEYNPVFFLEIDYIILTHHHGDHLNPATLSRVVRNYPHIRIILSDFMWRVITSDDFGKQGNDWRTPLLEHQSKFQVADSETLVTHDGRSFLFEPLSVKHGDIVNTAVQISDPDLDFEFLYASDLDNLGGERAFTDCYGDMQHVTGLHQSKEYTCVFLEANYNESVLQDWYDNLSLDDPDYRGKKARADGNLRHISEQEAGIYVQKHLKENGLFIPLHASKTFGTLYQD